MDIRGIFSPFHIVIFYNFSLCHAPDVNTLASVIAVNLGIVPTHSFEPMVPNPNEDLHGGTRYM